MSSMKAECSAEPKWRALVDDVGVPVPQRKLAVAVLKGQSGLGKEFVLVRDHNSPNDVVLDDGQEVDLADGNVFYRLRKCDVQPRGVCDAPAKLALFVDDHPEVTLRTAQTAGQVLQLFGIAKHRQLIRDLESPNDVVLAPEGELPFSDGPVFITRSVQGVLKVTVNSRVFTESDGVNSRMTGLQIAALVFPDAPSKARVWRKTEGEEAVGLDQCIDIANCDAFDVVRDGVTGGFEAARVQHETGALLEGGAKVSIVADPPAVVYHDLTVKPGFPVQATDVLITIPSAYPGQMIDGAYLPDNSPLFGRVKGSPQDTRVTALGNRWRLVSYHPHTNGVGPAWDPSRHGFHTYLGEVMSWLQDIN